MTAETIGVAVAAAGGRDEEFRGCYAATYADVAGYCLALTADPGLADDMAQEALTQTYVHWRRLHTPRGYAFRVARNLAYGHRKRRARELATWSDIAAYAAPSSSTDPAVWDAVGRLPDAQREVVLLHYLYDLPLADVATAIRRPLGTVKRRLHEGRALLARALEESR
jgi:RNA polymerase sigma-70 factor (ECF subfamily)